MCIIVRPKAFRKEPIQMMKSKNAHGCRFEVEAVYGDLTLESPKADEQRAIYVARMKNHATKSLMNRKDNRYG